MTRAARMFLAPSAPPSPARAHWDEELVALADGQRLRAVSAGAGRAGVRAGMTVAQARARCAALCILPWDEPAVARAVTAATGALVAASPQVTPVSGAPGMWWVGASGFEALGGERALLHALMRIARRWHPRPRVAIADSCVAARAATWTPERDGLVHLVPPGGDAAYLAPAPLPLLPMEDELRETLLALGLRTVGQLAALDVEDVERRWGAEGVQAWRLARGDDRRRPVLARVDVPHAVEAELPAPAETMEPVLFLVKAALDRLVPELAAEGRAVAALALTLAVDDGRPTLPGARAHTITREVRMARPVARVAPLFERCHALLDRWALPAPARGVTVAVVASAPLAGEQGSLLDAQWRDPAAAEAAFARLRAELGPNVVVKPALRDTHRPEQAGAWVDIDAAADAAPPDDTGGAAPDDAGDDADGDAGAPAADADGHHALRLLEAPEPVDVECAGEAPAVLWWRGRRLTIARAVGPERLSGDWWRDAYRRDYWRCEGEAGALLLYRARGADDDALRWFLHGWYD